MSYKIITNKDFLHRECRFAKGGGAISLKLRSYLLTNKNAVGIASNQLGYEVSAFAIRRSDGCINVFVNPEKIIESGNKSVEMESCLSLKKSYKIERSEKVEFKILEYSPNGYPQFRKYKFTGYEARVVQHELDHLDGILISDKGVINDSL